MKVLIVLAAAFVCALANNSACPHPDEAVVLVHEEPVVVESPEEGREGVRLDVPADVLEGHAITCISVVAMTQETSPGYLGAGRNREGGISVVMNSKERSPLEATVYIYASGGGDDNDDGPDPEPEPEPETKVIRKASRVKITTFRE